MRRFLWGLLALLVLVLIGGAGFAWYLHRRTLPDYTGTVRVPGIHKPVEILRDSWGSPHIFAATLEDAAYAQGWAVAQDRLFQLELTRRLTQGRLAEVVGPAALDLDKLHRTLNLHGEGRRIWERASPQAKALVDAYNRGVNAYVEHLGGNLPIEFVLMRIGFPPLKPDDLVGVLPFMAFGLMETWRMEPIYRQLEAKLGPQRFAQLFPDAQGAPISPYVSTAMAPPTILTAGVAAGERLGFLGPLGASNNWVVAPKKSASGKAILANDPHLGLALPPIWYTAHMVTPGLEVAGATIPGFPSVILGHNREIAWGLTNLMADAGDFFLEKINPENPAQVMHLGKWIAMAEREETIHVKGEASVTLKVRTTPHGPLITDLVKGQTEAISLSWTLYDAKDANELDAFYLVNTARNWEEFRKGIALMGGISQNFAYADRHGNIGMQAGGRVPTRKGDPTGTRYRVGWDGSQEWSGYVPFERMPSAYNPPEGWLATANSGPLRRPAPFYMASAYEPRDRWLRIREVLTAKEKLSAADMQALQFDDTWVGGRELAAHIRAAYAGSPPAAPAEQGALKLLEGWKGEMRADSPAAALVATFLPAVYREIFTDEFGEALVTETFSRSNLHGTLVRLVLEGDSTWLDRIDTPQKEGWPDVVRPAFAKAVATLTEQLGGDPAAWQWGKLHTYEAVHPLGRLKVLAPYFNLGPYPVAGHAMTVRKMQYAHGGFKVNHGASVRMVTDFADVNRTLIALPGGTSGIRASPHYGDEMRLWLAGTLRVLPMDRAEIEKQLQARQVLEPATGATAR